MSSKKANARKPSATRKSTQAKPTATVMTATDAWRGGLNAASDFAARYWRYAFWGILLLAAFLRMYDIDLKPFHHDEGVNGFFLLNLYRNGVYHYDPTNYHGPTLYFFSFTLSCVNALLFGKEYGMSDLSVRLTTALFGVGVVWLTLRLRRHLGALATLAAAALLAVSPGMVFISRYFIHEILFVFFSLGIIVFWLDFLDAPPAANETTGRETGWWSLLSAALLAVFTYQAAMRPESVRVLAPCVAFLLVATLVTLYLYDGKRALYLLLSAVNAALLFATKETAFITIGVFLIAVVAVSAYFKLHAQTPLNDWKRRAEIEETPAPARALLREPLRLAVLIVGALSLFLTVGLMFYSSFFTFPEGVAGAVKALKVWQTTGSRDHIHPFYKYLIWLRDEEAALLLLGFGGTIIALWRAPRKFIVFCALWAIGIVGAYSVIPYKTPWLALSFLPPLAIMAGYLINWLNGANGNEGAQGTNLWAIIFLVAAVIYGLGQSVSLNFYHYDDDRYPYVYAHTRRDYQRLLADIAKVTERPGAQGRDTGIIIASPEYWPMPWSLRHYSKAYFYGNAANLNEALIIARDDQTAELTTRIGGTHRDIGKYDMRPGVVLHLWVRNDLVP